MIKDRLLNLPNEIEEKKLELFNKTQGLEDIKARIKTWELMEIVDISNEVDEKGKAVYSNDTKRQAELQERKDNSDVYKNYTDIAKSLEIEIANINIKLDKLFNEQSNLRAICRLEGQADE